MKLAFFLAVAAFLALGPSRARAAEAEYIYGIHDPGRESLMSSAKGWIVFTEGIGHNASDTSGRDYRYWSNQGYGVIVRLNNGYGSDGTLPYEANYAAFAERCANYVSHSQGCDYWIIGNETNLPREWPGNVDGNAATGEPITAARYVSCYNQCYSAIKSAASGAKIMPSPSGTWAPPYPAQGIPGFLDYWINILNSIGATKVDGLAVHAYTHGCDPALATSNAKMGSPYENIFYNFRVYRNYLGALPLAFRSKPVYITECDQNIECADNSSPRRTWSNSANGWMSAVYGEVNNWNNTSTQKIRCVAMFRWEMASEGEWTFGWSLLDGVKTDFQAAVAKGYRWGSAPGMVDASPGGLNLSLTAEQTAVDSSFDANSTGAKARDGLIGPSSKWASQGTSPPHWLAFDIGADKIVNGYIVHHAGAGGEQASYNTQSFSIQSAPSLAGPWTDEAIVENMLRENSTRRLYQTPKPLRYVRLHIPDPGIDNFARICEFEVHGYSGALPAAIEVSTDSMAASANQGASPSGRPFTVRNSGGGTLSYAITRNQSWLSLDAYSGTSAGESDTITISFATGSLAAGTHQATITVSDTAGQAASKVIGVTVTINDVTAPAISGAAVDPACARTGSLVSHSASVTDNAGGSGVTAGGIWLAGPNLLVNPSFETGGAGTLAGWLNTSSIPFGSSNYYPSPGTAKDGSFWAGVSCGYASGVKSPELRQTIPVTAGKTYQISAWVYTDGSPNPASSFLQWKDGTPPTGDGQCVTVASFSSNTMGWQRLFGTVTPSTNQLTICLRLSWDCASSGGGGNWDMAETRQVYAPASYFSGLATWDLVPASSQPLVITASDAAGNTATGMSAAPAMDGLPPAASASTRSFTNSPATVNWTASDQGCAGAIASGSVRLFLRKEGGAWVDSGAAAQSGSAGSFSASLNSGDGRYYFTVVASDTLGNAIAPPSGVSGNGMASTLFDSTLPSASAIAAAKQQPDTAKVYLQDKSVSGVFGESFYVQDDAPAGLLVEPDALPGGIAAGGIADISGLMATSVTGERYISGAAALVSGSRAVSPLRLNNQALGGEDWLYNSATGAGQRGVAGAAGLTTTGLLVRICGRVTDAGPNWLLVDDGSAVRVLCMASAALGVPGLSAGSFVTVTGMSSLEERPEGPGRMVKLRSAADVAVLIP